MYTRTRNQEFEFDFEKAYNKKNWEFVFEFLK
jgi:hypothetical protein